MEFVEYVNDKLISLGLVFGNIKFRLGEDTLTS